jgi:hypothetical protein
MNPEALLALIGDLYAQNAALAAQCQQLQAQLAQAQQGKQED